MIRPVRLTRKQKNIMGLVLQKAGQGSFFTVTELHERMSRDRECAYGALRKSLDVLENAGMIMRERRTGDNFKEVKPTLKGFDWFRPLRN